MTISQLIPSPDVILQERQKGRFGPNACLNCKEWGQGHEQLCANCSHYIFEFTHGPCYNTAAALLTNYTNNLSWSTESDPHWHQLYLRSIVNLLTDNYSDLYAHPDEDHNTLTYAKTTFIAALPTPVLADIQDVAHLLGLTLP